MIKIDEPALALNDMRVGGRIRVSRNVRIRANDERENIIGCIATLASGMRNGRLQSLVLNSHGAPGYLVMGEGFWAPHTNLFSRLAGLVNNIWITACEIASREPLAPGDRLDPSFGDGEAGDGWVFCRDIARYAKCNVIASDDDQWAPNHRIPDGYIDSFEGTVRCWRPNGEYAWVRQYSLLPTE
jgi:hypothetical protein